MKQAQQRPDPRSQTPTLETREHPRLDEHGDVKRKAKQRKQEKLKTSTGKRT